MTQPNETAEVVPNGAESQSEPLLPSGEGNDTGEQNNEPDSFSREYVHELREEAKGYRENLEEVTKRGDTYFELLKLRTLEAATSDLMRATSDMPADDPRYYDNAGFPSLEGMREVAQEILQQKPYLAKPHGDVKQGVREESQEEDGASVLGGAIRGLL